MLNFSASEENYIKAIYHLQQQDGTVTTNELAARLQAKPASITDMMKKLKVKKLVNYQPYQGFRLTAEGNKVALGIIRRHRLWEYFLAEKLNFSWDEVHEIAEDMEHVSSKKLIDKLDAFLGYPKFDPHGDPIPDANGKLEVGKKICLTQLQSHKQAIVSQVTNQSAELLDLLKHQGISIGTKLEVKKRFDFDKSIEIKVSKLPIITISEQLAKNIYVKYDS